MKYEINVITEGGKVTWVGVLRNGKVVKTYKTVRSARNYIARVDGKVPTK